MEMYLVGYEIGIRILIIARFARSVDAARFARHWERALERQGRWHNPLVKMYRVNQYTSGPGLFDVNGWKVYRSVQTRQCYKNMHPICN